MFYYDFSRSQFENELVYFISNSEQISEFMGKHGNGEHHLGLETQSVLFLESVYRNYRFLSHYLNLKWNVPTMQEVRLDNMSGYDTTKYFLYEYHASLIIKHLEPITKVIYKQLKVFLNGELTYWKYNYYPLYTFIKGVGEDGEVHSYS